MNNPLWSAVIPTYGEYGVKLTRRCLRSMQLSSEAHEIIVVDDGSDPVVQEDLERLCREYGTKLVLKRDNTGFARACNEGILQASGQIVILVNNDTEMINKTLDDLANFALFTNAATVGCKLLYEDNTIQHAGVHYVPSEPHGWWDHIARHEQRWAAYACRIRRGLSTGAMLAIGRGALDTVGLLDERYGMAVEDIDYQLRCLETGMSIYYCGLIEAYHLEGRTRGNTPEEKAKHPEWTKAEASALETFFERWEGINWNQFRLGAG